MTSKHFAMAALAALLMSSSGNAQNASDVLQKGLHLQEAAGDVDGAIGFFRQVVTSAASTNKPLAAQAQYQLVLCMLQKGDRAAAEKELAALENNFPNMPDLLKKARKLIPGSAALLPSPWGDTECSQLNIKRDGEETGEYLYYSADAWSVTVTEKARKDYAAVVQGNPIPAGRSDLRQAIFLRWELKTKNSSRSIEIHADRDTLQPTKPWYYGQPDNSSTYHSDDDLGDPLAAPFTGPATDLKESVFLLRRRRWRWIQDHHTGDVRYHRSRPTGTGGNGNRERPNRRGEIQLLQGVVQQHRPDVLDRGGGAGQLVKFQSGTRGSRSGKDLGIGGPDGANYQGDEDGWNQAFPNLSWNLGALSERTSIFRPRSETPL